MNYVLYLHDPDNKLIPELSVEIAQKRFNHLLNSWGFFTVTVDLVPEDKRIVELERELEEFENMDEFDVPHLYAIVTCPKCGREMAVNMENANDKILCADCDRVVYHYLVTEAVLPIEDACSD